MRRSGRRSDAGRVTLFAILGVSLVLGAAYTFASFVYFVGLTALTVDLLPYAVGSGTAVVLIVIFALLAPPND